MSRFKVANGLEEAVKEAFLNRPHLVDDAPGFLGMETFQASGDPAAFYLVTRWTDEASFQAWHKSPAHQASHKGIPKGLKLEPEFTEITLLERLQSCPESVNRDEAVADASPFIARYLEQTAALHVLAASKEGTIRLLNPAMAALLRLPVPEAQGAAIWPRLTVPDAGRLKELAETGGRRFLHKLLLNFVSVDQQVHTLVCSVDVLPDGFVLIGELPLRPYQDLNAELLRLNNELSQLSRENAQKSRALEQALAELKSAQAMLVHEEKLASLGRMTAGVAHEINNPLAFITNNHTTLGRDLEDVLSFLAEVQAALPELCRVAPQRGERLTSRFAELSLDHVRTSALRKLAANVEGLERVKQIVLDLRQFSRLDEGDSKRCDLGANLAAALRFLEPLLQERQVKLTTRFAPMDPLLCRPGHLNQAISNIVQNAVQASPSGGEVLVRTQAENGGCVIEVVDHGAGIPPDVMPRVFEPFFTTKPPGMGTGLGLAIAHQIVKAHRGEIQIQSQVGHGTCVRVTLPFQNE